MKKQQKQVKVAKSRLRARDNGVLALMCLPAMLLVFLFNYMPMYGIILAFKKYQAPKGIWGSPWVGFKNFEFLFKSEDLARILTNTLWLNALFIVVSLVASVAFALLMYEVRKAWQVKVFQTVASPSIKASMSAWSL